MIISIFIYLIFAGMFFIGERPAKAGEFNADYLDAEPSKGLKGLAVIGVLLHHISQVLEKSGHLSCFTGLGFLFVGIFFFFSGYGLYKSYLSKPAYLKNFFRNRMLPIAGTVFLMNIIYAVYKLTAQHDSVADWTAARWVLGFLNISPINDQAWYPFVILIMYAVFWLAFTRFKSVKVSVIFITAGIMIQVALFIVGGHFAWWMPKGWYHGPASLGNAEWWQGVCALCFQGEWWVNSTMAFTMGLIWAINSEKISDFLKKRYAVKLVILGILAAGAITAEIFTLDNVSFWSEFSPLGKNGDIRHMDKFICWLVQQVEIFFVITFICAVRLKVIGKNRFLSVMSALSLEFYLMQRLALTVANPILVGENMPETKIALYMITVFAVDFVAALILKFIVKKIFTKKTAKS